jgi:hypothetical protein
VAIRCDSRVGAFAIIVTLLTTVLLQVAVVRAQGQRPLRSEKTIPFKMDQLQDLQMVAGPITVRSVKFSSNPRESLGARFRSRTASETETTVRGSFDAENPDKDEWSATFVLEFLDAKGKLIDRVSRSSTWEGEAKVFNLDHPILTYVVPLVDQVKISITAKLD